MRALIWLATAILFLAWMSSFFGWLYLHGGRRALILAFAFQVAAVTMASFLDKGTS